MTSQDPPRQPPGPDDPPPGTQPPWQQYQYPPPPYPGPPPWQQYQYPPPGAQPPPWQQYQYPPPYPGPPPPWQAPVPPTPATSANTAMWAHLGALLVWLAGLVVFAPLSLFSFVVPLVIRSSNPGDFLVRHHATQSLNSCLTGLVVGLGAILAAAIAFVGSGFILAVLIVLAAIGFGVARAVCGIIGAVKAYHGERYTYPIWAAFHFIRDDTA
jgi:uncharacterized Tic20 family protein